MTYVKKVCYNNRCKGMILLLTRETLIKNAGKLVDIKFVENIINNLSFSEHSLERMKKRTTKVKLYDNDVNKIKQNILDSMKDRYGLLKITLAYINTDGSVNVAITPYDYYVFDLSNDEKSWVLVTFKEKSYNDISIFEKLKLAQKGIGRVPYKGQRETNKK